MSADRKLKGLRHWLAERDNVSHKKAGERLARMSDDQIRALKQERVKHREACQRASVTGKNELVKCEVCGELPTVENTGLCGPCCFGEASTAGGNW